MKILVVVHDLITEKSHLMPWRTCCEAVNHLAREGYDAHLLSLGKGKAHLQGGLIPSNTRQIRKKKQWFEQDLNDEISRFCPDVIIWPVSWRENTYRLRVVTQTNIPVVVWFPGGVYSFSACVHAIKVLRFKAILPYLRECLSDKKKRVRTFKKNRVRATLAMTGATARNIVDAGWPSSCSFVVPPGKDKAIAPHNGSLPDSVGSWLQDKPYYLYMGPPSGIRGIYDLLEAFELAALTNQDIRLICLFRSDAVLDMEDIKNRISAMKSCSRIYCVWESLPRDVLNAYMSSCHAVTMPFIFVPSEIPLAIIEVMAWGKPVITTSPGGTGEFVSTFGISAKVGDKAALAKALIDLEVDRELYEFKCIQSRQAFESHPDWGSVAESWLEVAEFAVEGVAGRSVVR